MTYKINKWGIKVLAKLSNNHREPDKQIGEKIGMTGSGVKKSMMFMMKNHIIERFSIKVQPQAFGYSYLYIAVPDKRVDDVIKLIQFIGEPNSIIPCTGRMTLCSIVMKNKAKTGELADKLTKDVRVMFTFEAKDPCIENTETCLKILDEMDKVGRRHPKTRVRHTGIKKQTIRSHIEKLLHCDAIQFTLRFNPTNMGSFISHIMFVRMDSKIKKTIKEITAMFDERCLEPPIIAEKQMMLFVYSNIFEMDDMEQKIRSMQNVQSVNVFIPKKISFDHEWLRHAQ